MSSTSQSLWPEMVLMHSLIAAKLRHSITVIRNSCNSSADKLVIDQLLPSITVIVRNWRWIREIFQLRFWYLTTKIWIAVLSWPSLATVAFLMVILSADGLLIASRCHDISNCIPWTAENNPVVYEAFRVQKPSSFSESRSQVVTYFF